VFGLGRTAEYALNENSKLHYWKFETEQRRNQMKPSTTDQIEGKLHELKGDAKMKLGQLTDNPKLKAKGQGEKLAGTVQKKVGQIEKVLEK
jgi:uncharacterized protein YjbJ (UPF0337 family)